MPEGGLLCVHAHPDDEAIVTGGVLIRAAEEGHHTAVVTCTGGEHGEIAGSGIDPSLSPEQLRELRARELAEALRILGADGPHMLGFVDSGMMGTPTNGAAGSFWQTPLDAAVEPLVAHIRELRPAVLVTYDAFGVYGHPDHIQTHRVAVAAVHAAACAALYPELGGHWQVPKAYFATMSRSAITQCNVELLALDLPSPFSEELDIGTPDSRITCTVDVRNELGRKLSALRAHHSQLGRDSLFLNIPDDIAPLLLGTEMFERWHCDVAAPDVETDLFAGL